MLGFERPEGLIKGRRSASTLIRNGLEKLALKQVSIFNLNCYYICRKILNTCKNKLFLMNLQSFNMH